MQTDQGFDLFLSHAAPDIDRLMLSATGLEKLGLKVFLYEKKIKPADNLPQNQRSNRKKPLFIHHSLTWSFAMAIQRLPVLPLAVKAKTQNSPPDANSK